MLVSFNKGFIKFGLGFIILVKDLLKMYFKIVIKFD